MKKSLIFLLILMLLLAACGDNAAAPVVEESGGGETAVTEPETAPAEEPAAEPVEEPEPAAEGQTLILATTTSTQDSGLLDYILPVYEEMYNVSVDVIAVGTGQAIQLGEDGNADVLLVHARSKEDAFMDAGHGVRREDVMYNDFVILGPSADPAGILGKNKAARAFEMIAEAASPFVSRGDDSGTHTKEKAIWTEAGIEPAGDWYISAGQGMGAVLTMADEQQAYTLSDRATYLARTLEGTSLGIMVEGDPILFNPYGVIAVNPDKGDHIQVDLANQFIDWLTSLTTQELIAEFGVAEFGAPLFTPDSAAWRETNAAAEPAESAEPQTLILATTTSTQDSGLLDAILPVFEESFNVSVDVIAVGTGQAIQLGEDGNADVILVHARSREDAFMDAGHGVRREDVMYNDFVILGPADDPAGILGKNKASRAFEMIAEAAALFVSRGDDSGTHTKELAIWAEAGLEPAGDWYISAGQGMGAVLTMANEQQAYTLSDRATYLARTLEGIDLGIMVEGDPILFNPYGVIAVNPDKGDHIQTDLANLFIDWLISMPTQELISEFGVAEFGAPLFTPDSAEWRAMMGGEAAGEDTAAADADLRITGLVDNEMGWSEDEVRAMETMDAEAVNNSGAAETYTGVSINALLELAGLKNRATAVTLLDADGNSIEIPLADLQACTDCILSFRNQGGFSTTLPAFPDLERLRGVVEIQVK